ncbi:MAG: ribonuclease HII, partial [Phyllobacteriaceae bacterium]|nr:ribonuclease HII [Phyllobacteriaceae bacterium]
KGDARSLSIAAASIVAKVLRDRLMTRAAEDFPGYGLEIHKGYGTAAHLAALAALGASPLHRATFAPVARALGRVGEGAVSPSEDGLL